MQTSYESYEYIISFQACRDTFNTEAVTLSYSGTAFQNSKDAY
jgi:hypothetical protein